MEEGGFLRDEVDSETKISEVEGISAVEVVGGLEGLISEAKVNSQGEAEARWAVEVKRTRLIKMEVEEVAVAVVARPVVRAQFEC